MKWKTTERMKLNRYCYIKIKMYMKKTLRLNKEKRQNKQGKVHPRYFFQDSNFPSIAQKGLLEIISSGYNAYNLKTELSMYSLVVF